MDMLFLKEELKDKKVQRIMREIEINERIDKIGRWVNEKNF
jgi:hypothetical protein